MSIQIIPPYKGFNPAFRKIPVVSETLEKFKIAVNRLKSQAKEDETEEYHKGLIRDFLSSIYGNEYTINTKDNIDLAIFNGNKVGAQPSVLIEVKSPVNETEMFRESRANVKSLQELVYYFMEEYIRLGNKEIKYLTITNYNDWYFFSAKDFLDFFTASSNPVYDEFKKIQGRNASQFQNSIFYEKIAKPAIDKFLERENISIVHFNLDQAVKYVEDGEDKELSYLYKFLAPETASKKACNDSRDKALLALLNSRMVWWLMNKKCTQIQNGVQLIWKYLSKIPMPRELPQKLSALADQIISAKKDEDNLVVSDLEKKINATVYELYGLTQDEIDIVEKAKW